MNGIKRTEEKPYSHGARNALTSTIACATAISKSSFKIQRSNRDAWASSQILKQNKLQVDSWSTDIFGNQYGLYKDIKNIAPANRKNITGEIWVRKNSQFTSPGYISLARVFDTYANTSIVNELTGTGIRKLDVFFDTLMVETSGAVIFEKIIYDYNTDEIFSLTDQARYLSLAMPVSSNLDKEFVNTNLNNYTFAKALS